MKVRIFSFMLAGIALLVSVQSLCAKDTDLQFKLRPGARGDVCLKCHVAFQEKIALPHVHTPLKMKDCSSCHNPHTSNHGSLLATDSKTVCAICHKSVIPEKARSVHKVVAEWGCLKCHDPHAAANKFNLVLEGRQLCFSCHKPLGEKIAKLKYRHNPVEKSCLLCHLPHASEKGPFLLKNEISALCLGCHRPDKPMFIKKHMGYPVESARCTGCHNPHGSDNPGLLLKNVHPPVAKRMCNQCHEAANSKDPLKRKKQGTALCRGCHSEMINRTFDKSRVHWALLGKEGCLGCHNPHASDYKSLIRKPMAQLCGDCHADTLRRIQKSASKHEPVADGRCTECHDPHSSNFLSLAKKNPGYELCAGCHDWSQHSTHPIGEKVRDPRNKNLTLGCTSCHRTHGNDNKKMLHQSTTTEMCLQCHEQLRR